MARTHQRGWQSQQSRRTRSGLIFLLPSVEGRDGRSGSVVCTAPGGGIDSVSTRTMPMPGGSAQTARRALLCAVRTVRSSRSAPSGTSQYISECLGRTRQVFPHHPDGSR